jgi:hypothetical protein
MTEFDLRCQWDEAAVVAEGDGCNEQWEKWMPKKKLKIIFHFRSMIDVTQHKLEYNDKTSGIMGTTSPFFNKFGHLDRADYSFSYVAFLFRSLLI